MFAFADPSDDPIAGPIEAGQLDWSARVAVGLDRLVEDFELDSLTYYYRGLEDNEAERLGAGMIVGNSLLTARGVLTSGEADIKTNVAQLLLDRLGAGGELFLIFCELAATPGPLPRLTSIRRTTSKPSSRRWS